jgi:hypothetical protein
MEPSAPLDNCEVFARTGPAHGRAVKLQKDQFSAQFHFAQSRPVYEVLSISRLPIVPKRFT